MQQIKGIQTSLAVLVSVTLLCLCLLLFNCTSQDKSRETEKGKLLLLHKAQQDAHIHKNAKQFVAQFADSMFSVNRGKISITTKDSALKRFGTYFSNVEFKKWEDVNPPVIDLSADASMAYIVVDKLVVLNYPDEENKKIEETTRFAWVSVYRKQANGDWKIVCNVSTNEPGSTKVLPD